MIARNDFVPGKMYRWTFPSDDSTLFVGELVDLRNATGRILYRTHSTYAPERPRPPMYGAYVSLFELEEIECLTS